MKLFRKADAFKRDEEGSATVEAVLWLPIMIALLALAADASFIFFGQNQAYRIVQNANRSLSTGRLHSAQEVENYIKSSLSSFAPNAVVKSTIAQGMVSSKVEIPSSDLAATGLIDTLLNTTITVGGRHFVEY